MGFEAASGSADARVRSHPWARDVAVNVSEGSMYLVATPESPPRLWSWLVRDVAEAYRSAVAGLTPSAETMRLGIAAAANALGKLRSQLIEPHLTLDARFGAIVVVGDSIHVALTAGVRLYRARAGVPERLFSKAQRPSGIGGGNPFTASERVEHGDLLILGTRDAFAVRSIGNLASALSRGGRAPVADLCEAVIGPSRDSGVGAAAVVLRAN